MYENPFNDSVHRTRLSVKIPRVRQTIFYNYVQFNYCISPASSLTSYVSDSTYYKHPASFQSSTSRFSYKPTYTNKCTLNHTKYPPNDHHTPLHYYDLVQLYGHPSLTQDKIYYFINKNSRTNSSHVISSCTVANHRT